MNVVISHKQDTNFLKDGVYEIVGINNNIVDIKCIDKIVKVDINDTDFTFIFNKFDRLLLLPCNIGDTVYKVVYNHCCTDPTLDYYDILTTKFNLDMINEVGHSVFTSLESAKSEFKRRTTNKISSI